MKDLANNIIGVSSLVPLVRTADANGDGVDLQGFEAAMFMVSMGAEGDTLSSSVKIDFKLEESDDNSSFSAVSSSLSVTDGSVDSNGIFATFDDNAEAPAIAAIGYVGGKRYIRVVADHTGTLSNGSPYGAVVIMGSPRHAGGADSSSSS